MAFTERQLVVAVIDLARFVSAVRGMGASEIAGLVDRYYHEVAGPVTAAGGRIVKFLGDAVLVVFPPDRATDALTAVQSLEGVVRELCGDHGIDLQLGANLHLSTVAEGEFGVDGRHDVIGAGVNHAFRMGSGPGIRISEPVYRKLPSHLRGSWEKHQQPATYALAVR